MNNDEMHALYLPFVYPFIPGAKVNMVDSVLQSTARVRAGIVKVVAQQTWTTETSVNKAEGTAARLYSCNARALSRVARIE